MSLVIGLLLLASPAQAQTSEATIFRLITKVIDWYELDVSPGVAFAGTCRTYWDITGTFKYSCNGAPFATLGSGTVGGTGAATQIAVWSAASTLTGYPDFTWDSTKFFLVASDQSTITGDINGAAIIASAGTNAISATFAAQGLGIVASSDATIGDGDSGGTPAQAGLLGTSCGYILGGSYNAVIGASGSGIGANTSVTPDCIPTPGATDSTSYSAIAGSSQSSIIGGTYAFLGGVSNTLIDGTTGAGDATYAVIIGASDSINRGLYSAIAGDSSGLIDTGVTSAGLLATGNTNTIDGGAYASAIVAADASTLTATYVAAIVGSAGSSIDGTAGNSLTGSVILGGNNNSFVTAGVNQSGSSLLSAVGSNAITHQGVVLVGDNLHSVAANSVSIGQSATPEMTLTATTVALGGSTTFTLGSVIFTGLGAFANGTLLYCTDCDPTATLLACTHIGAQTGAFAYRVAGAWKCMG